MLLLTGWCDGGDLANARRADGSPNRIAVNLIDHRHMVTIANYLPIIARLA